MEKQPQIDTYLPVLAESTYPPSIEARDSGLEKKLKRRRLQQWYTRRRQLMESYYYNWLRAHANDGRTHPLTVEVMSRWMIEQTAAAEAAPTMRRRRRDQLTKRWQRFTRRARVETAR